MIDLDIKTGDEIMYSCAAGRQRALVRSVRSGPTAKTGVSIPWLHITVLPTQSKPFPSYLSLPADASSLKMYNVEKI